MSTAKAFNSKRPKKNDGMLIPIKEITVNILSVTVCCFTALIIPAGIPIKIEIVKETKASSSVGPA
jgi:hypothetical protein